MLDEFLPWAFRLVGAFLVVWSVATVLCRLLRWTGVIPYPPFSSRKEYLTAALEMDLEEFVERAKVTPVSVKQKVPEEKPLPSFELMTEISKTLGDHADIKQAVDATWSSGGPCIGIGALAYVAANAYGNPSLPKSSPRLDEKLARKFPLDRWFRTRKGELVKVVATFSGVVTCVTWGGVQSYLPNDLGPAVPKSGEWWRWTKYDLLGGFHATHLEPFQFGVTAIPRFTLEVEAGNLQPVNFGKGEEKKSGVA